MSDNIFNVTVLTVDAPTANGRIYTKEAVEQMIKQQKQAIKGYLGNPGDITAMSHIVSDLTLDGNNVTAKVKFLNTPMGNMAGALYDQDRIYFATTGAGVVDDNMTVSNYELLSVDAFLKPNS